MCQQFVSLVVVAKQRRQQRRRLRCLRLVVHKVNVNVFDQRQLIRQCAAEYFLKIYMYITMPRQTFARVQCILNMLHLICT